MPLFSPPFFLKNPHVQTLGSYGLSLFKNPKSITHYVTLPDQDQIALEISLPKKAQRLQKVVLMMPGTAGSHLSRYLIRLTQRFLKHSMVVARLNFRGVGTALGRAKKISHAGSTQDVLYALHALKKLFPSLELTVIGFSLSGNTLLKLASEHCLEKKVKRLIAVCPPLELQKSSSLLEKKENRWYQNSIVQTILKVITHPKSNFEFKPLKGFSHIQTLREFDEAYTAPSWGFADAMDYYEKSSCLHQLEHIQVKTHLLFAQDDPLIDCQSLQQKKLPKNIDVLLTTYGGHMGYLKCSLKNPFWMDEQILSWLNT